MKNAINKDERDVYAISNNSAAGGLVEPIEVAKAIVFLASKLASGITGVNLPVDVGRLASGSWDTYGRVPDRI